ncbi:MAG: hypothetical protein HQM09_09965 [Candidatus Riflebacteria bacterium]|nr:hypothetical protein [Candidatus Riflebacteria bacterium]
MSSRIVSFIEEFARLRPLRKKRAQPGSNAIPRGSTIAIIGGGLAGPAFARRALCLASETGIPIRVELLTHHNCNFCAGLITDLTLKTMNDLYGLSIPAQVIKETISEVIFISRHGSLKLPLLAPLTSVLRTNKFSQKGFDDSWIDSVFKGLRTFSSFNVRRNARVTEISRKKIGSGFLVTYEKGTEIHTLDADFTVIATGLKSIQQLFMQRFISDFGYQPPEQVDASVTEIDTIGATHYDFSGRILVIDGVVEDCLVAFIPKGRGWLTVTGLGKVLANHHMEILFNNPLVKQYIRLENVVDHLRCRKICSASVAGKPARTFFGDGWVMIGDLTGYGRALKDGYFAALRSADLAARALICHGPSEASFHQNYFKPVSKLSFDNQIGMMLYNLDQRFVNGPVGKLLFGTAHAELRRDAYGGLVTAALRALFTGELSYKMILALFASGIGSHLLRGGKSAAI